jgi:hypothetical protein
MAAAAATAAAAGPQEDESLLQAPSSQDINDIKAQILAAFESGDEARAFRLAMQSVLLRTTQNVTASGGRRSFILAQVRWRHLRTGSLRMMVAYDCHPDLTEAVCIDMCVQDVRRAADELCEGHEEQSN